MRWYEWVILAQQLTGAWLWGVVGFYLIMGAGRLVRRTLAGRG